MIIPRLRIPTPRAITNRIRNPKAEVLVQGEAVKPRQRELTEEEAERLNRFDFSMTRTYFRNS